MGPKGRGWQFKELLANREALMRRLPEGLGRLLYLIQNENPGSEV
jgi:hypothetical protein